MRVNNGVEWVSVNELKQIVNNGKINDYEVIDLREREDYKRGHIRGAKNIPFDEFMKINDYSKILTGRKTVIVYCVRGGSSIYAAYRLKDKGYHVKSLIGGMTEYEKYS